MLKIFFRTIAMYIFVILSVRLMGKRQIGELQPSELVITILLSEIVSMPIENNNMPILSVVVPVLTLISLEIISSCIAVKSSLFGKIIQGNPVYVIRQGKIDTKQMRRLRFTVDDLLDSLRQKDIFDVSEVDYAVVETNGSLSVCQKDSKKPVTKSDLGLPSEKCSIPFVVINDGRYVEDNFGYCNTDKEKINKILEKNNKQMKSILLMTIDCDENIVIVDKE